ncbi:MAG TPA: hypothetical protein VH683_10295 [Thermoleophilaceae bacterium]|jgi:hypothetical protein
MSTPEPDRVQEPPREDPNRWLYWAIGGVVVVLCVIGLIAYSGKKEDEEARQKAQELTQKLEQAGLRAPEDEDIFVRTFGTDGGAVCDNPGDSLGKAILFDQFTNGGSQVGRRPVIVDGRLLQAQRLILETYCPDELDEFREDFDDLKTDDVIRD